METKRILQPIYKLRGGQFLHLDCQGKKRFPLWLPVSYATAFHTVQNYVAC